MSDKALIIEEASMLLLKNSKIKAINVINSRYKFEYIPVYSRNYTDELKIKLFYRDGFIDRYTGEKLVIPGILKILSFYFPKQFPYQSHWKMTETHMSYWELTPTIDHIVPIALGGEDKELNMVTTSMLNNSIKSNWTLEQMRWRLCDKGTLNEWDGLTKLFVQLVEHDETLLIDQYIKKWYNLVKRVIDNRF